ncbi:cilia- and flagella-associated protein 44 [Salmo salar]|uniref:Cilia- and flagella-associated protein 44 n=1 Tax=Salmo salar TaxID=8030 RepID=A0A1S3MLS1_SALSA|nr:cilia- and flagella-associated protein 44 [Salmo salar]|eukprot:XP_014003771.1 PREDICTED: cilia- and flagella-associated protein 44-like [Salmo salar]
MGEVPHHHGSDTRTHWPWITLIHPHFKPICHCVSLQAHPSKRYFAVAEKGDQPNIVPHYNSTAFSEGTLLASVGSAPDYMLTLWEWRHEQAMLCCKAFVLTGRLRVTFSPDNAGQLTTSGSGHMK